MIIAAKTLVSPEDPVDFVLTSHIATMLFTQLSEEPDLVETYDHIFLRHQCRFLLKPLSSYFADDTQIPSSFTFMDLINMTHHHEEVCIGFKSNLAEFQKDPYYGVYLNPPKDQIFHFEIEHTFLVVVGPHRTQYEDHQVDSLF